jgi:DNA-binding HxlR family transcriptional regulator
VVVASAGPDEHCAFTKAVEHLADRWTFLIVADLVRCGPRGFNALAAGLPGRISRSVLAERLRRLERLGIITRHGDRGDEGDRGDGGDRDGSAYRLTAVGDGLASTMLALRDWAAVWLPDDPAAAERDPDIVLAWLMRRIDDAHLPERRTVVELSTRSGSEHRGWLVIEKGREPYGCFEDPLLDECHYVYVTAAITVLLALAHGTCRWSDALANGSVRVSGRPQLLDQLPRWFL